MTWSVGKQRRGHIEAERLRSLEVDHKLKLGLRPDRELAGIGTTHNAINIISSARHQIQSIDSIRQQSPRFGMIAERIHRRQPVLAREFDNESKMNLGDGVGNRQDRRWVAPRQRR